MKKIKTLFILLFVALLVTGCGSKEKDSIDMKNVNNVLFESGYTVYDVTSKYGFATTAYLVDQDDVRLTVLQGENENEVLGVYVDEAKNVYKKVKKDYKKTVDGGENWNTIKLVDEENIYFVGFVDSTYITLSAPVKKKAKIEKMIEELGF